MNSNSPVYDEFSTLNSVYRTRKEKVVTAIQDPAVATSNRLSYLSKRGIRKKYNYHDIKNSLAGEDINFSKLVPSYVYT